MKFAIAVALFAVVLPGNLQTFKHRFWQVICVWASARLQ
jgi:hypothetical protein